MRNQTISAIKSGHFFIIAGPCIIENRDTPEKIALQLKNLSEKHQIPIVFKASYRKANRSSLDSFTGIGDEIALEIIQDIGRKFDIAVTTDIHSVREAELAANYVDIIQIPAFLCRQTDLLLAAGKTGKIVNVKKGQFMSPESMRFAADKIKSVNPHLMITERGTSFGYQDLIVDFRSVVRNEGILRYRRCRLYSCAAEA